MSIKRIDIVHHSHADFGFTDHPLRARALQKGYVGQAMELVLGSRDLAVPFAWTCEVSLPVLDWWKEAGDASRSLFLEAVGTGNLDVCGLPVNVTSLLNADEWAFLAKWVPEGLMGEWRVRSAMQNDVNGLHTAGLMKMMDAGIENLWIGPNTYNALPPMPTPCAFFWKMPDGRRLFTWMNASYCDGFFLFNRNWRQGPVPDSADLRYRAPGEGDIFRTDDASMERAYRLCRANIASIEGSADGSSQLERDGFTQNRIYGGYPHGTLCVSLTNQWRIDNDPPFYPARAFVEKWNGMGLLPELRLTTATRAMADMKEEAGESLPEYSGQWPDWWANGAAAAPAPLSASRQAKRAFSAATSPVFGPWAPEDGKGVGETLYNLCMYDEHTSGSWSAVSAPSGAAARAGKAEKEIFAYRALGAARALLAGRAKALPGAGEEGVTLINPSPSPFKGYVEFPAHCLRGTYAYLESASERAAVGYAPGPGNFRRPGSQADLGDEDDTGTFMGALKDGNARIWVELAPLSVNRYLPATGEAGDGAAPAPAPYGCLSVEADGEGWPVRIRFDEGEEASLGGELGGFFSIGCDGFAPRWIFKDIFAAEPAGRREEMAGELLSRHEAHSFGPARVEEDGHALVYSQAFSHPSLTRGKRVLEISKHEKKATLRIKINRRPDPAPEILYAAISIAPGGIMPRISNAGGWFTPGEGQIPGSCMDYYAIDGAVSWREGENAWLAGSRDAAVVSFGEPGIPKRIEGLPDNVDRALFMLFNNTWDTNFAADEHGAMEFAFDLLCGGGLPEDAACRAATEPVAIINLREEMVDGDEDI